MIFWSGRGILSILVLIAVIAIFSAILPVDFEDFAFVFGFLAAGLFSWYFGKKWNHGHGRILIDKETGKEVELKSNHTLFWIKIQYWGIIFFVIGLIVLIKTLS
ncbi:MAG: hypothetical protein ACM3PT_01370 [Deltaproteobacteria bacterium]